MNVFDVWRQKQLSKEDDHCCISDYINLSDEMREVLINGNVNDQQLVFDVLNELETEQIIATLTSTKSVDGLSFTPAEVPCFSTMLNGMVRLPELLEFYPNGMSFYEIGYQMKKQSNDFACIKYGENHAKLAAKMSLVTITNTKPAVISLTAIGHHLVKYSLDEKKRVLTALLLRDSFMQFLIKHIVVGDSSYAEIVSFLKPSTAYRRKTSVKQLAEFILEDTTYKEQLSQFEWKV